MEYLKNNYITKPKTNIIDDKFSYYKPYLINLLNSFFDIKTPPIDQPLRLPEKEKIIRYEKPEKVIQRQKPIYNNVIDLDKTPEDSMPNYLLYIVIIILFAYYIKK